jgi:putative spermidine/putrescine transport system permease protein
MSRIFPQSLGSTWLALPAVLLFALLLLYPVARLILLSLTSEGGLTLEHYQQFFATDLYINVLIYTLRMAVVVTVMCVLLGYPVAYVIATSGRGPAGVLTALVVLPLVISVLVRSFAWIALLQGSGPVPELLRLIPFVDTPPELLYTTSGVLIGLIHVMLPYAILPTLSVMLGIDRNLGKAAAGLGAGPFRSFLTVYLPLSLPGVAAGALLTFILTTGFFITPALLGGRQDLMVAQLIEVQVQRFLDFSFASAISVVLIVVTLGVVASLWRIVPIGNFLAGDNR